MMDIARIRREATRWHILQTLDNNRPLPCHEETVLAVIRAVYPDASQREARRELDYLFDRGLITVEKRPDGVWWSDLTRCGIDLVEYTVPCDPGISRPQRV
jgi:hypothetical protein